MSIRIIIADDHAVFRSGLSALLEKEDEFDVVGEAKSGLDAIRLVEEIQFDVLLLDLSMPGLHGTRVAEEVIKKKPRALIIVLTMHENEHYLRELLRIGARGYVLKKSTGNELANAIRAVFRGDSYIDPTMAGLVISPYVGRPTAKKGGRLELLTAREREVCKHLAYGYTNSEVGEKLSISMRTVESHRSGIMTKLDLRSRAELVQFAIDYGLLQTQ